MKVSVDLVSKFIKDLEYLVEGIKDTMRMGDDGYEESCMMQADQILSHIRNFTMEKLTPLTPLKKTEPAYVAKAARIDYSNGDKTVTENITWYKARLYRFIKKNLSKIPNLDVVKTADLFCTIEATVIIGSERETAFYSNEWFYTSDGVLRDVVNEIVKHREAHPQTSLF